MDGVALPWEHSADEGQVDTIRALLHDVRGPVEAILLLTSSAGVQSDRRLQSIRAQAGWLASLVEAALAEGAHDDLVVVDVRAAIDRAVTLARHRSDATMGVAAGPPASAWARPVALGRALDCVLDNAGRAAGSEGHVAVGVGAEPGTGAVSIDIVDDGPGLGRIASGTALGLTTTRAMVAACGGAFRLGAGEQGGAMAQIRLAPATIERVAG